MMANNPLVCIVLVFLTAEAKFRLACPRLRQKVYTSANLPTLPYNCTFYSNADIIGGELHPVDKPTFPPDFKDMEKDVPNIQRPRIGGWSTEILCFLNTPAHNFWVTAYGPGYAFLVQHYLRLYSATLSHVLYRPHLGPNKSGIEPDFYRESIKYHLVMLNGLVFSYPDIECPFWLRDGLYCHLFGDTVLIQDWQKWTDTWIETRFSSGEAITCENGDEYFWYGGNPYYSLAFRFDVLRTYKCDPTKNECPPLPQKDWPNTGSEIVTSEYPSTLNYPTGYVTNSTTVAATTTWSTPRFETDRESRTDKMREVYRKYWPIPFVTFIFVLLGVLPLLYLRSKRKAEEEEISRWYKTSSLDQRVNFLIMTPPAYPPGWPPGPREPRDSRTFRAPPPGEEAGYGAPPPPKRARTGL